MDTINHDRWIKRICLSSHGNCWLGACLSLKLHPSRWHRIRDSEKLINFLSVYEFNWLFSLFFRGNEQAMETGELRCEKYEMVFPRIRRDCCSRSIWLLQTLFTQEKWAFIRNHRERTISRRIKGNETVFHLRSFAFSLHRAIVIKINLQSFFNFSLSASFMLQRICYEKLKHLFLSDSYFLPPRCFNL